MIFRSLVQRQRTYYHLLLERLLLLQGLLLSSLWGLCKLNKLISGDLQTNFKQLSFQPFDQEKLVEEISQSG